MITTLTLEDGSRLVEVRVELADEALPADPPAGDVGGGDDVVAARRARQALASDQIASAADAALVALGIARATLADQTAWATDED